MMHAPWTIYNPQIHACAYHVCLVCVKCMHMHLHCICVLTPTRVEHKDCRCICRHGMHTMGCILSTKLTSTKLEIVEKSCNCICRHACVVCLCMCTCTWYNCACMHACLYACCMCICLHVHICFHNQPVHTIVQHVKRPDMQTTDKVCAQQTRTYNKDSKLSEK